jgi:hypothetical protein
MVKTIGGYNQKSLIVKMEDLWLPVDFWLTNILILIFLNLKNRVYF